VQIKTDKSARSAASFLRAPPAILLDTELG